MKKGDGKNPKGTRWLMVSGAWIQTQWITKGRYTENEVKQWECSTPVRPVEDA